MKFMQRIFGAAPAPDRPEAFEARLNPGSAFYVVGDVHGRIDLLERLIARMDADALAQGITRPEIIFVGDFVDRGEHSAEVLSCVQALTRDPDRAVTCLMGNHEKMMLDFLERPTERGPRWLKFGGLQTMMSFGVRGISERMEEADLLQARDALRGAMPDGLEAWLSALPLSFVSGNVTVVHAAADPDIPLSGQDSRTLLWGHKNFFKKTRQDGQWVVHGHTIVDQAEATLGRISVDTGAYATGRLTCARISDSGVAFLTA